MDKSTKLYVKALDMYNKGYINKALDLCEKSISQNIRNSATINLKGLLLYLKGDLDSAQKLWKMNVQMNKDGVSQKYLKDSREDEEKFALYTKAVKCVNEIKIKEALIILKECSESDYNCLNVNNYLAICYIRQGNYDEAVKALDKVLALDKENVAALDAMKNLKKLGVIKSNIDYKSIGMVAISVVVFFGIIYFGKVFLYKFKNINYVFTNKDKIIGKMLEKNKTSDEEVKKEKVIKEEVGKNEEISPKVGESAPEQEVFPYEELNKEIGLGDYEQIYNIYMNWKDKDLKINDKALLNKSYELLKSNGVEYFYNSGYKYMINKDYKNAQIMFLKGYDLGKDHYLHSEILYMLGRISEDTGDVENALKYYVEYNVNFPNGPYSDIVLYNISTLFNSTGNKDKAKEYAKNLVNKYPNSIYNNSRIKNIISQ